MMSKPSVKDQYSFLFASMLCALHEGSRHWGLTASYAQRLLAFSPFAVIGSWAAITQNTMLIVLVGAAMLATVVVTTASDKWGTFLAEKLQETLRKLESSARQAAQVISNLPHVEKIRLPKIYFTSAILPIAPPPPRAHLAG
ncbi:MAG: hypothetical protein WC298_07360 [Sideroxydans sp.]|jgi:hypothetical protein